MSCWRIPIGAENEPVHEKYHITVIGEWYNVLRHYRCRWRLAKCIITGVFFRIHPGNN